MYVLQEVVKLYMILILCLEQAKVRCKYARGKALCNFKFVGNSNVCPICHCLRDINSRNVMCMILTLTFIMGHGPKVNCKYASGKATCDFLY